MNQRFEWVAAALCVTALLVSAAMVGGCAGRPSGAGDDSVAQRPSVAATLPAPLGEEPTRAPSWTYGRAQDYDVTFTKVKDLSSVRETYGIDVNFPADAAGGTLVGLWMTPPDVDGGNVWALYDMSLVEIHIWIAPTLEEALRGNASDAAAPAADVSGGVNGHPAITVPRTWVPEMYPNYTRGPAVIPAHWSAASVSWAQGLLVITVSSGERDVEDLLGVARAVEITGEAKMPMPDKFKKQ